MYVEEMSETIINREGWSDVKRDKVSTFHLNP